MNKLFSGKVTSPVKLAGMMIFLFSQVGYVGSQQGILQMAIFRAVILPRNTWKRRSAKIRLVIPNLGIKPNATGGIYNPRIWTPTI